MTVVYEMIQQLLEMLYGICGDYGIAIVLITIIIRGCLLPLNHRQRQAMKKQQKLSLQVEEIKHKYKNNTEKMNKEIEKLYQTEGAGSMGCLLTLIQFPIMLVLYNGIRLAITADVSTVLFPWIPSLLVRDSTYILPLITVLIQMIPQILPYISFFKRLNLPKTNASMIMIFLLTNGWFTSMIPAGIELYYMVSGLFTAIEQLIGYILEVKNIKMAEGV